MLVRQEDGRRIHKAGLRMMVEVSVRILGMMMVLMLGRSSDMALILILILILILRSLTMMRRKRALCARKQLPGEEQRRGRPKQEKLNRNEPQKQEPDDDGGEECTRRNVYSEKRDVVVDCEEGIHRRRSRICRDSGRATTPGASSVCLCVCVCGRREKETRDLKSRIRGMEGWRGGGQSLKVKGW
jgi:hypothetical protein